MTEDIIHLLSDHLSNQIAAGEVVQRPASVVKELMENALDAGASDITLQIKDAGKELIQVIDNGKGMSPMDARMCFERHATSKIRHIEDLFAIKTMGFRGEAMASIAAVAQVELVTMPHQANTGTRVVIDGGTVLTHESCASTPGTRITVRNLFYNIPARRHFLKTNTTELRHIIDEFFRIALINPDVQFKFFNNQQDVYRLTAGSFKQRIIDLMGKSFEANLIPVEEDLGDLKITGFVGKPAMATKTKSNQYFFLNNRFIRNAYLNHAVHAAFEGLIPQDQQAAYFIHIHLDPSKVDINVHPTKQEVKFEDDRLIYTVIHAAVKHALGKFNIAPAIDFNLDSHINLTSAVNSIPSQTNIQQAQSGFLAKSFSLPNQAHKIDQKGAYNDWKQFYDHVQSQSQDLERTPNTPTIPTSNEADSNLFSNPSPTPQQSFDKFPIISYHNQYLITTIKSGLILIDIERFYQRVWFEQLKPQQNTLAGQRLLFPVLINLNANEALLLESIMDILQNFGLEIKALGQGSFAINTVPSGLPAGIETSLIQEVLDQLQHEGQANPQALIDQMVKVLAIRMAYYSAQKPHSETEKEAIIHQLFSMPSPEFTPYGKPIFKVLTLDDLQNILR